VDYASPEVRAKSEALIADELAKMPDGVQKAQLVERLAAIEMGDRDLLF